jgi:hypothetical protein
MAHVFDQRKWHTDFARFDCELELSVIGLYPFYGRFPQSISSVFGDSVPVIARTEWVNVAALD